MYITKSAVYLLFSPELDDLGLDPYTFRVFLHIVRRCNNGTSECFERQNAMARHCGMSLRQLKKCLYELEKRNMISKKAMSGYNNVYYLVTDFNWVRQETNTDTRVGTVCTGGVHDVHGGVGTVCTTNKIYSLEENLIEEDPPLPPKAQEGKKEGGEVFPSQGMSVNPPKSSFKEKSKEVKEKKDARCNITVDFIKSAIQDKLLAVGGVIQDFLEWKRLQLSTSSYYKNNGIAPTDSAVLNHILRQVSPSQVQNDLDQILKPYFAVKQLNQRIIAQAVEVEEPPQREITPEEAEAARKEFMRKITEYRKQYELKQQEQKQFLGGM